MTIADFKYIDKSTCVDTDEPFVKPWTKVDDSGYNYSEMWQRKSVTNMRGHESEFTTDNTGFAVHHFPCKTSGADFDDDATVRGQYYAEVEAVLRAKLPGVAKVVIFDHTIRKREKASPRQPVQQVHVDQTPAAAAARVRRHVAAPDEAEARLRGRYQIINVWRPIGHAASDFPLAVVDWRTTAPADFVHVDLLYPVRRPDDDDDERGKEQANPLGDGARNQDHSGYEVRGETMGVAPSDRHQFWYLKDMTPDETMFIKCFDSRADGFEAGVKGRARCTPHTAFVDPETPRDAKGRQSIEVRCLVFYE